MSFTREQIKEIKEKLALLGSKDNNLPLANELSGEEIIAIVQDGENRKIEIGDFYDEFGRHIDQSKADFFNVSMYRQGEGSTDGVYLTLDLALENCPSIIRKGGQIITFLDKNGNWELWQCVSQAIEVSEDDWLNVDEYWKNLEDNPELGIILTASDTNVLFGESKDIIFHFETIDGGNASSVEISIYNAPHIRTEIRENVSNFDYTLEGVNTNTKFSVRAIQYGIIYEKEISINIAYPWWIGAGSDSYDITNNDNKKEVSTEINGEFNVFFDDFKRLVITIPRIITLHPVKMNGFNVPLESNPSQEILGNNIEYYTYRSANLYAQGWHKFTIGTYINDNDGVIQDLDLKVAGLREEIDSSNETNDQQTLDIEDITSRVESIEENALNTTDNEDLITVDNKYKFADKRYDRVNFSGKGRVYLRKNIVDIQDQNDPNITRRVNLLNNLLVSGTNNIYIIQYDYTLEDDELIFGNGSILQYAGGTISNGTLNISGVVLLPGWQNIIGENLTITGIPATGSYYFDSSENKLKISNGENWIEISGEIISD